MNDEQKRERLELYKGKVYLEYYEALALLRGKFPEILVKFADEEHVPGRLKLIVQNLESDIQQFELKVYFDVWYDYGREIHLDEPAYATQDTLNHFIPSGNFASWWIHGKLSPKELKDWLQNKGIANFFFGTTASHSPDSFIGKLPEPPSKPTPPVANEPSPQPEITQEDATILAGVDIEGYQNMKSLNGTWTGTIKGTNNGAVCVELTERQDRKLEGVLKLNDSDYGTSTYTVKGTRQDSTIHCSCTPKPTPISQATNDAIRQLKTVLPQRLHYLENLTGRYGSVELVGEIVHDGNIKGTWKADTIGTGGTFTITHSDYSECSSQQNTVSPLKEQVFILMAISADSEQKDRLNAIIRAAEAVGVEAKRADMIEHNNRITDLILEEIKQSRYIIADLTDSRPNVYYEMGYAHGLMREVVIIAKDGTSLHFDIKDYNAILFHSFTDLEDRLKKRLNSMKEITSNQSIISEPEAELQSSNIQP